MRNDASPAADLVRRTRDVKPLNLSWGTLVWLVSGRQTPGAEQTLGVVTIHPGKRNPLHLHPNCEELLYVIAGEAQHRLGDEVVPLTPGDVIRIPRGKPHWAQAVGEQPLVALVSFSSADRQTESLEETDDMV